MMGIQWTGKIAAISLGVGVLLGTASGLAIGWKIYHPKAAPQAAYQPAIQQTDGSVILESKPDAHAKPPNQVPAGAVVEHITHAIVQPDAVTPPINGNAPQDGVNPQAVTFPCPPVTIDLTAFRMKDGSHRVIASSPDGVIQGGSVDVPVEDAAPTPKATPNAAGYVGNFKTRHGVFYDRDLGPFRLGAEALYENISPAPANFQVNVKLGVRF